MPILLALLARAAEALPATADGVVAALGGRLWCAMDAGRRRAVRANREALGTSHALHLPFAAYLRALLGWLRLLRLEAAEVRSRTLVEGLESMLEAAERRGAVLVAAHVGEWEWGAAALGARGLRVLAVANRQLRAEWTPALHAAKGRLGVEVVAPDVSAARLAHALRRGAVVALLVDGDVSSATAPARVLGRPCNLPLGPARLAARCGARLLAGRCERDAATGGTHYRIRIAPLDGEIPAIPTSSAPSATSSGAAISSGAAMSSGAATSSGSPSSLETTLHDSVARWLSKTLTENPGRWCLFRPFFVPARKAIVAGAARRSAAA